MDLPSVGPRGPYGSSRLGPPGSGQSPLDRPKGGPWGVPSDLPLVGPMGLLWIHGASCIQRSPQIRPKGGSGGRPRSSLWSDLSLSSLSPGSGGPSLQYSQYWTQLAGFNAGVRTVAGMRRLPAFPCFPCFPCQPRDLDSLEFPYCF